MNPSNPTPAAGTAATATTKVGRYGVLGLFVAWLIIKRSSRTGYSSTCQPGAGPEGVAPYRF